jgi:hypothetical protein
LVKRPFFEHEDEIRLVYVEDGTTKVPRVQVSFDDPNALIDEVRFDPRLEGVDLQERHAMLKSGGYNGAIERWEAYQNFIWTVISKSNQQTS